MTPGDLPPTPVRLAKLTRPSSTGLIPRERLFESLDRGIAGGLVWIDGPAGAGKTSLATIWLKTRGLPHLWYQVDAGDADPATFFHHLGGAAEALGRHPALPLLPLTPEYLLDLDGYVRQFSARLWARLGQPFVLALDNFQALPAGAPLQHLLVTLADCLPEGCMVLVCSRQPPPPAFVRWMTAPSFTEVGWADLRLRDDEAAAIAAARHFGSPDLVESLNGLARGWSAGLVLLIRAASAGIGVAGADTETPQSILDYFAGELFARLPASDQETLARCAIPIRVTGTLAAAISANEAAPALLAELHAQRFFTDRLQAGSGEPQYEFHPLFREFLLDRLARTCPAETLGALRDRAAALVEQQGDVEQAMSLQLANRDWPSAARKIVALCPGVFARGRGATIDEWISALPDEVLDQTPWLRFWRGLSRFPMRLEAGRADLMAAYAAFTDRGDEMGRLAACSEILSSYVITWEDLSPCAKWIVEMDAIRGALPPDALLHMPVEVAARVLMGHVAIFMHQPSHPAVTDAVRQAEMRLRACDVPALRVVLANLPGLYHLWRGSFTRLEKLFEDQAATDDVADVAPAPYLLQMNNEICLAWQQARHADALALLERAERLAAATGVHICDASIAMQGAYTALSMQDFDLAERYVRKFGDSAGGDATMNRVHASWLRLCARYLRGERQVLEYAAPMIEEIVPYGVSFGVATFRIDFAQMLSLEGRYAEALTQLEEPWQIAEAMGSDILRFHVLMARAYAHLAGGTLQTGRECLAAALAIGRSGDYRNCHPLWIPRIMSFLFSRALEWGIEADYVRRFIRHRDVAPDSPEVAGWPWPLRVYAFGRFRVRKEDEPLHTGRKAQRRVLELLQAIAVLGPRGVSRELLVESLWPDADGDAGNDAFQITLHRLRKLLGAEEAVILEHGRVMFNPRLVWVDTEAFERLADEIERSEPSDLDGRLMRTLDKALTLYAEPLLAHEEERAWLLTPRARLRSRFHRLVTRGARTLQQSGSVDAAIDVTRRALEVEPLSEELHRQLIALHVAAGRNAEAADAYRQCEKLLRDVLGVSPSSETARALNGVALRP